VATPGRLLDHINAQRVNLSDLTMLVLDEADRMLDMGFADDINAILQAIPIAIAKPTAISLLTTPQLMTQKQLRQPML
jgi:superfamily II DNA/RNA helicase